MSSTVTRLQTPVHTYGRPEREPQHPYFNYEFSSYSADPRSLADDVNSYVHTEDLYNPGCSYVPHAYGPEYSKLEETEEVFGYDPMQNYASPQLLCPRPTLPPSQFSPQFSCYDWPSEAPANVYQSERSRYTSTSHPPQAEEIQHSFGNHQLMSKFSTQPEFAGPVPNPLASSYLGDGYTQPFVMPVPSFDQVPTRSTHFNVRSGYFSPHQPVSPEQRSSYSELAPNLNFMNNETQPRLVRKEPSHTRNFSTPKPKNDDAIAKGTMSSPDIEKNPFALGFDGPPLTAFGRKEPSKVPRRPVSIPAPSKPSKPPVYIS